jgi:microsomal dipeptidase-like Zn-dependent dipeptidase
MHDADLLEHAAEIHRRYPVVECHTDIVVDTRRRLAAGEPSPLASDYLQRLRQGGVRFQVLAVGGDVPKQFDDGRPDLWALEAIDEVRAEAGACPELCIIGGARDLDDAIGGDSVGLILHLEGLRPILTGARGPDELRPLQPARDAASQAGIGGAGELGPLPSDPVEALGRLYELGLRSAQLTWNGPNAVADGVGVAEPKGLSPLGRRVVRELGRLGMVIDVAHLAEPGFWDVLDTANGPIVCSHANAKAICDHRRNLSDGQIHAIAATGGFVGVCFIPDFIGLPATIDGLIDHVDYIASLVGISHVAVGPDYVEFAIDLLAEPGQEDGYLGPEGLRRVETLPVFTAALLDRGYSEGDVAAILGGNALRVMRVVL